MHENLPDDNFYVLYTPRLDIIARTPHVYCTVALVYNLQTLRLHGATYCCMYVEFLLTHDSVSQSFVIPFSDYEMQVLKRQLKPTAWLLS